ncbi:hypothetical protein H4Q32_021424 [Labeo rohita]|uniref:Uncharacterized protein n=1 Tax=Labeo rohita TaxID=84645 RepID=A0ABQ8MQX1_LABRO|nr:hypothetical protein H4Q32_021424 [Labeo rohita]
MTFVHCSGYFPFRF